MAGGNVKGKKKEQALYAHALPIIPITSTNLPSRALGILGAPLYTLSNPRCVGVFDVKSRSVWIVNARDTLILWRRGFFGKGNLSRSEPSWLARRINELNGIKVLTAEEATAKRREERKLFKSERAQAIVAAAAEAEALFRTEGKAPAPPVENISTTVRANLAAQRKENNRVSAATPDLDPSPSTPTTQLIEPFPLPEDMEHLQLTLQEAFFLSWGLDCLDVLDPTSGKHLDRDTAFSLYLSAYTYPLPPSISNPLRFDNPFLVHYAIYHHFRSLGWVVKSGIKFCCDYLLYKKGPVFTHAEFSIVLCPTYEDPADEESSPFNLPNTKPFSWSWLSTLNRVNTQVRKSLMLAYVTIPAMSRVSLDKMSGPEILKEYSVREVTIKRFAPARMRD